MSGALELIGTERLDLVPFPLAAYGALLEGGIVEVEELLGARLDGEALTLLPARLLRRRIDQLERDPAELPWLLRAVVARGHDTVAAVLGFHGPPDADGTVEIGYRVAAAWQGRGIATEAARGLAAWASTQPGARRLRASVAPDNAASLRVVAKLGLVEVGRQIDEEDGLEVVLEGDLPLE